MTTVFLSGSRRISRINEAIRNRVGNIVDQKLNIVIGDANGADKVLQNYLADTRYENVIVFCAGGVCRNNLGNWEIKTVLVDPKLKGRAFYTQKDRVMASEADYGFVLWDGKSPGAANNMLELIKLGKTVVVYFGPDKSFRNLKKVKDLEELFRSCSEEDYRAINSKIQLDHTLEYLRSSQQGSLGL